MALGSKPMIVAEAAWTDEMDQFGENTSSSNAFPPFYEISVRCIHNIKAQFVSKMYLQWENLKERRTCWKVTASLWFHRLMLTSTGFSEIHDLRETYKTYAKNASFPARFIWRSSIYLINNVVHVFQQQRILAWSRVWNNSMSTN